MVAKFVTSAPGLAVIGIDSCSNGCEFEPQGWIKKDQSLAKWAVILVRLVKRCLLAPEIPSSNLLICNFNELSTV